MPRVPSAIVDRAFNLLLNPARPQAGDCRLLTVARHPFDDRLLVASPGREN